MTQIEPYNLWIGHADDGRDYGRMGEEGIEALVSLAAEEPCEQPPRDLLYLRFPLVDGIGNRADWLDLAVTSIAKLLEMKIPTLVACGAGKSRAPTIAAAALAVAFDLNPEDSLRFIAAKHPSDVAPGFWDEVKVVLDRKRQSHDQTAG
jgi:hypothetical protein